MLLHNCHSEKNGQMIVAAGYNNMVLTALQQYFEDAGIHIQLLNLKEKRALEDFSNVTTDVECCLLDLSFSDRRFEENFTKLRQSIEKLPTVVLHDYQHSNAETLTQNLGAVVELLSIHSDPDDIVNAVKKTLR